MSRASTPRSGAEHHQQQRPPARSDDALEPARQHRTAAPAARATRSAPPSVVNASRPRATSRSPGLTKSSTPSVLEPRAPATELRVADVRARGRPRRPRAPWVRAVTSSWSSMPMRTGTGHSSAQLLEVPVIGGLGQADGHRTERRPGSTAVRLPQQRPHAVTVTHQEGGDRRRRGHEGDERARQGGQGRHRRGEDQGSGGQLPGVAAGRTRRHDQQDPAGSRPGQRGPEQGPSCDAVRIGARAGIPAGKRYGHRPGEDREHDRRRHPCREDEVHEERPRPLRTGRREPGPGPSVPPAQDGPGRPVLRERDGDCAATWHLPRRERHDSPPPWTVRST